MFYYLNIAEIDICYFPYHGWRKILVDIKNPEKKRNLLISRDCFYLDIKVDAGKSGG